MHVERHSSGPANIPVDNTPQFGRGRDGCTPQKAEGKLSSSGGTLGQQNTACHQQDPPIISATGQLWAGSSVQGVADVDEYRGTNNLCILSSYSRQDFTESSFLSADSKLLPVPKVR